MPPMRKTAASHRQAHSMSLPIPRYYLSPTGTVGDHVPCDENGGFSPLVVEMPGGRRGVLMFSSAQEAERYSEKTGADGHLAVVFCSQEQLRELLTEQQACGPSVVIVDRNPGLSTYYAAEAQPIIDALLVATEGELLSQFNLFTQDGLRLAPGNRST